MANNIQPNTTLLIPLFLFLVLSVLPGAGGAADDDPAATKAAAEKTVKRMSMFQEEASKLSASDVFKEIERQQTLLSIKQQSGKSAFLFFDEGLERATGYAMELQARRMVNDPAGAYYYGLYNLRICGGFEASDKDQRLGVVANKCWLESIESFKVASAAQMGAASFNIARMYEKGKGVLPSKLVAADWFAKAAQQFNDSGSREEMLTAIEAALNAVPDHPEALRLRKAYLK